MAILIASLAGAYAVFGRSMNLVRQANYNSVADRNTLARMDQIRSRGWSKLVDPNVVAATLGTPLATTASSLPLTEEKIAVSPRAVPRTAQSPPSATPAANPTPFYVVKRTGTAAPTVSSSGVSLDTLQKEKQLSVTVTTTWRDSGRSRTREMTGVVAKTASR